MRLEQILIHVNIFDLLEVQNSVLEAQILVRDFTLEFEEERQFARFGHAGLTGNQGRVNRAKRRAGLRSEHHAFARVACDLEHFEALCETCSGGFDVQNIKRIKIYFALEIGQRERTVIGNDSQILNFCKRSRALTSTHW